MYLLSQGSFSSKNFWGTPFKKFSYPGKLVKAHVRGTVKRHWGERYPIGKPESNQWESFYQRCHQRLTREMGRDVGRPG